MILDITTEQAAVVELAGLLIVPEPFDVPTCQECVAGLVPTPRPVVNGPIIPEYGPCPHCDGTGREPITLRWHPLHSAVLRGITRASRRVRITGDAVPIVDDYDSIGSAYQGPAAIEVGEDTTYTTGEDGTSEVYRWARLWPAWESALDYGDGRDVDLGAEPARWVGQVAYPVEVESEAGRLWYSGGGELQHGQGVH